jgi:hypothetical protein
MRAVAGMIRAAFLDRLKERRLIGVEQPKGIGALVVRWFDHCWLEVRSRSGSLATLAAIRLASSFVSSLAADRRPDSST